MLFISILLSSMVISIPSIKNHISSIIFQRLSTIILIYAGALAFNAFYIQSIGSGIGIYGGLFQNVIYLIELLILFILILILFRAWAEPEPLNYYTNYRLNSTQLLYKF
jgi:NADH-ubiquinone oxidoreductase chain 2